MNEEHRAGQVKWKIRDPILIVLSLLIVMLPVTMLNELDLKYKDYFVTFVCHIYLFFAVILVLEIRKAKWAELGLSRAFNARPIILGVLAAIIILQVKILLLLLSSGFDIYSFSRKNIFTIILLPFTISGFSMLILAPFTEEIMFRGMLYQALRSRLNKPISIIIVSILFSLAHLTFSIPHLLTHFVHSVCLTLLFDRYRELPASIICHSLLNFFAITHRILSSTPLE